MFGQNKNPFGQTVARCVDRGNLTIIIRAKGTLTFGRGVSGGNRALRSHDRCSDLV